MVTFNFPKPEFDVDIKQILSCRAIELKFIEGISPEVLEALQEVGQLPGMKEEDAQLLSETEFLIKNVPTHYVLDEISKAISSGLQNAGLKAVIHYYK